MLLPHKLKAVYDYLKKYQDCNGIMPSYREIMDGANVSSTSVVNSRLRQLSELGLIDLVKRNGSRTARGIRIKRQAGG